MNRENEYKAKPIMLFVSKVGEADGEHFGTEMEYILDIQLSPEQVHELLELLKDRSIDSYSGTKSFRLKGRLIL